MGDVIIVYEVIRRDDALALAPSAEHIAAAPLFLGENDNLGSCCSIDEKPRTMMMMMMKKKMMMIPKLPTRTTRICLVVLAAFLCECAVVVVSFQPPNHLQERRPIILPAAEAAPFTTTSLLLATPQSPTEESKSSQPPAAASSSSLNADQLDFTCGYLNKHHGDVLGAIAETFSRLGEVKAKRNSWSGGSYKIDSAKIVDIIGTQSIVLDVMVQERNKKEAEVERVTVDLGRSTRPPGLYTVPPSCKSHIHCLSN